MTNVINKAITEFEVLSSFPQYDFDYVDLIKELKACKEALEQPAQEPVVFCKHGVPKGVCTLGEKDCNKHGWNSLTKIEIMELFKVYPSDPGFHMLCDQVKLIDDKLKEKNA